MTASSLWPAFLGEVLVSPSKHYLWLRSLSYLEYIGYRKMVKAVPYAEVNRGVFHHLNDEIQHSFMLRELAEKVFGRSSAEKKALHELIQIAEDYFQGLDSRIEDWVTEKKGSEDPYLCYLFVSYVIEKRAMQVYPHYFASLTTSPLKIVVQKIIKDESEHLAYLEGVMRHLPPLLSPKDSPLFQLEEGCFEDYLGRMNEFFDRWAEAPVLPLRSKRLASARNAAR